MDNWQKELATKLKDFISDGSKISENPVIISINKPEAYIALKALEAQEKYENPMLVLPPDMDKPLMLHTKPGYIKHR